MYGYVWLCLTMYDYVGYVWLCMAMHGYVRLCMDMYDYLLLCMTLYDFVSVTVYDCIWLWMTMYYVCLFLTLFDSVLHGLTLIDSLSSCLTYFDSFWLCVWLFSYCLIHAYRILASCMEVLENFVVVVGWWSWPALGLSFGSSWRVWLKEFVLNVKSVLRSEVCLLVKLVNFQARKWQVNLYLDCWDKIFLEHPSYKPATV